MGNLSWTSDTNTKLYPNKSVRVMRALALAAIPSLSWRHHGIGVLQGYLKEGDGTEVRLHIWHKSLMKEGISLSGDIHDHRFDLVSHVLAGNLGHGECFAEEDPRGEWKMLQLTHARAAKETLYHGPTTPIWGTFRVRVNTTLIPCGFTYEFPAKHFHKSTIWGEKVVVTCVEKRNQTNTPARLLFPGSIALVHSFGHEIDQEKIARVITEARSALEKLLKDGGEL